MCNLCEIPYQSDLHFLGFIMSQDDHALIYYAFPIIFCEHTKIQIQNLLNLKYTKQATVTQP